MSGWAGLFFADADHVRNQIRNAVARSKPHAVILDAETMPYIDVTAITMREQVAGDLERNRDLRDVRTDL